MKLKPSASYQCGGYNRPSASYQHGGYNSNEYQAFTRDGPVVYGLTPGSKHYQDPVSMEGSIFNLLLCVLRDTKGFFCYSKNNPSTWNIFYSTY